MIALKEADTQINPVIVVVAYDRFNSLQRLLNSIQKANYTNYQNIKLIISVDGGGPREVALIAQNFNWNYGEKEVIIHPKNLGLRNHIISCGNLTAQHEAVIILEDDLIISPNYYDYSVQAVNFYKHDPAIAGVSLYSYRINENCYLPFEALPDGNDVFFMQVPCSWGQIWTRKQWLDFISFYDSKPQVTQQDKLPENVILWPETSWKKYFYKYLVDNNLFFVYPQHSYSTNFGDAGQHLTINNNYLQVPLVNGITNPPIKFTSFKESNVKYDAFFEIYPDCLQVYGVELPFGNIILDMYGTKPLELFAGEFVLSIHACDKPIKSYDLRLHPIVNNIILEIAGSVISLGRKENFVKGNFKKTKILSITNPNIYDSIDREYKNNFIFKMGRYILRPADILKSLKKTFGKE